MSMVRKFRNIVVATGFAVAALITSTAQPAVAATPDADPGVQAIYCWYEYDIYRINNVVYASAFKDCTNLEAPQPLGVAIQAYVGDEWGSTWANWVKGYGNVSTVCPAPGILLRHSITREQIQCP